MLFRSDGEWKDMDRVTEIIEVAGSEPIIIEVRSTHHGPIVSDRSYPINLNPEEDQFSFADEARIELPDNFSVSLSWPALIPGSTFVGIRDFNYAKNWDEFREASRLFDVPAQNLL